VDDVGTRDWISSARSSGRCEDSRDRRTEAEEPTAAAVAGGGRVVDDENAPAFVVLADPQGNKACVWASLTR
jgi:hypothetical protein